MRRIFLVLLIAFSVLTTVGCSLNNSLVNEEQSNSENLSLNCKELAEIVLNSVDFPDMLEVTNEQILDEIIDFSQSGITDYYVYQQMMSVDLGEIIVLKSEKPDETLSALEQRKETIINQLAFYPEQQESANGTVVGQKNGVCYLIAHKDGSIAEKALLEAI